jgi:enoyl-CoA hydratase
VPAGALHNALGVEPTRLPHHPCPGGIAMITTTADGPVDLITIERHERRNALDMAHLVELREAVERALARGARAIVVTGAGSSFCAGADLDNVYGGDFRKELYATLSTITSAQVPVVAAVNGPAIGAGTQLLAGGGPARSLLLGCSSLDAAAALGHGLADRAGGVADALAWASDIATMAPLTLRYSKLALESLLEDGADDQALDAAFEACWTSDDLVEAGRARAEKRQPEFRGR